MKKFESTWETKADVMGDTRADVRAEVSFWKVEKNVKLLVIFYFGSFLSVQKMGAVQICRLSKICKTGQLSLGEGVINGDKGFCANVDRLPGPLSASACSRIPLQKEPGWSSLASCCPPASPWTSRPRCPSS